MKFLTVTCLSAAALQLAVIVTRDMIWMPDDLEEITMCKSMPAAKSAGVSAVQPFYRNEDEAFLTEVVNASRMQLRLGRLASEKAVGRDIKNFGWMMFTDHTRLESEIRALAETEGVGLSGDCIECDQVLAELEKLEGKLFDTRYMEMAMDYHEKVIDKFFVHLARGKDVKVRSWVDKGLPVLQRQLSTARKLKP